MTMVSSQNLKRDAYITGLRELADWLESHPDVAVPYVAEIAVPLDSNEQVSEFAAAAGVGVVTDQNGNTRARVEFGAFTYYGYGYADFAGFSEELREKAARKWAEHHGLAMQPQGGAA